VTRAKITVPCMLSLIIGLGLVFAFPGSTNWSDKAAYGSSCNFNGGLLPNLQTAVPHHLQIVNQQQKELLRLSNGIANTGDGTWQMVPVIPADKNSPQKANQQFLDSNGNIVATCATGSESVYHPAHKHFHISDVASFAVHPGSIKNPPLSGSLKVTSCLIDWVRLEGNSPDNERQYASCDSGVQGISPGWVDQYHMALEGQFIDITGAPAGTYYLVSKGNPNGLFYEENKGDNTAWVKFKLSRDGTGNPKIEITGHSPCSGGLCGEDFPNR
jgi:Lysyl oxidase